MIAKQLKTALTGVALILLALPAFAGWYPNEYAGVSVYFPDHWLVSVSDYEIAAATQDDNVHLRIGILESADVEAAVANLEREVMASVTDFQTDGYYETTLNGMPALVGEATGFINGYPAEVALMIIQTPTQKALMIFGAGYQQSVAQYQGDIDQILANISPL